MSLLQLGPVLFGGTPGIIAYLQTKHVLSSRKQCPCGTAMQLQDRNDISDGCRWRCPACRRTLSIRDGSFFSRSRLPLQKWLLLIYWWGRQYPVGDAMEEAEVTEATAIQVLSVTHSSAQFNYYCNVYRCIHGCVMCAVTA